MMEKPELPPAPAFDTCIAIEWPYDGNGMPEGAVYESQMKFEDAIEKLDASKELCVQVMVVTGNGTKEWCFYSHDRNQFMEAFNEALAGHERYPLTIRFYDDPDWQVWREARDPLLERTARTKH